MAHSNFKISGLPPEEWLTVAERPDLVQKSLEIWAEFATGPDQFQMLTSGSTGGVPTVREFSRQQIEYSCRSTADFLGLQSGMRAGCPLSLDYTAGRMMLYRSIVSGFDFYPVEPARRLDMRGEFDLVAMVPGQVLASFPNKNFTVRKLIVGGAAVGREVEHALAQIKTEAFETFGMTETLSHFAMRRIGMENVFTALPGVSFSTDTHRCLKVYNALPGLPELQTREVVNLLDATHFEWIGRFDNMMNLDGVKVFPELVEQKLREWIRVPFFITAVPDARYGITPVLFYESDRNLSDIPLELLPKHERPRRCIRVSEIKTTVSGKIIRDYRNYTTFLAEM